MCFALEGMLVIFLVYKRSLFFFHFHSYIPTSTRPIPLFLFLLSHLQLQQNPKSSSQTWSQTHFNNLHKFF
ncbi:hypothetical protein Hanom_Chr05g00389671 [Helianthus anomalus]